MNGPMFWNALLRGLANVGHNEENMMIAGGCIRDWLLGLEPKDIDIFIGSGNTHFNAPETWEAGEQNRDEEYFGRGGPQNITAIHNYRVANTDVQVIYCNRSIYAHLASFDLKLSNAFFTLTGGLTVPQPVIDSLESKTILANLHRTAANTMERAERFLAKVSEVEEGWRIDREQIRHEMPMAAPQNLVFNRLPPPAFAGLGGDWA